MSSKMSSTKSTSIRNIENTYGINMTTVKPWVLDKLTRGFNGRPVIGGIADLMLGSRKFDIENMTEEELTNLRYVTLSTKEVLDIVDRKTKSIYYKPRYKRLRFLMSYEDFYQICMDKLMLNNGILKFDANYKLDPAIHFWFDRVAMWKCKHRANVADEVTLLDSPCNSDSDTTIGDLILHDKFAELNDNDTDVEFRIKHLLSSMDKNTSNRIAFRVGNTEIPMSEYSLAKLFIVYHLGKKELSKMMFNVTNNKLVSNQIFNKFYKKMVMHLAKLVDEEAMCIGERFSINEQDL